MNNLKIKGFLWTDDNNNRTYSIIFKDLVYHLYYEVTGEIEIDVGEVLTQIMYCDINEEEQLKEGHICLKKDFKPREVIDRQEVDALYLRTLILSNKVCKIYEC